jgi:hypothetical protein
MRRNRKSTCKHQVLSGGRSHPRLQTSEACVAAQRSEWFHKFQTQPEMTDFIKRLTGWDELHLLKRQLLRAAMPQGDTTIIHCKCSLVYLRPDEESADC